MTANLEDLHARLEHKHCCHQPIRRVHIPKGGGKVRPIGISAFEDKLVQDALREVLESTYGPDFLERSYGFRAGRSAQDAVRSLSRIVRKGEAVSVNTDVALLFTLHASTYLALAARAA